MKKVSVLFVILLSTVANIAVAHEGHGSGVGHDLYHMLLTLFVVAVPVSAVLWWQRRKSN